MATHLEGEIQKEKFSLEYGITSHRDVLAPPHVIQRTWVVAAEVIRGEGIQPLDLSALVGFGVLLGVCAGLAILRHVLMRKEKDELRVRGYTTEERKIDAAREAEL